MKGSVKLPVFIDDARKLVNTTQLRAKYLGASYEAEYCQWQTLHGLGSLMETASLIITPNAYLEGKLLASYPPDPIGDFDVTRATTATRVNSAGLVELVPYNLAQYSQTFTNGVWGVAGYGNVATIVANDAIAPDGTMTASKATFTAAGTQGRLVQSISTTNGQAYNASFYVKQGNKTTINFYSDAAVFGTFITFNFNTGTITNSNNIYGSNVENVGNGWYRISFWSYAPSSTAQFGFITFGGEDGFCYIWGSQFEQNTTATTYQKTETRLNIPRLDYSNGTCPSILVEPQRTNLLTYSSSFNTNLPWQSYGSAVITANNATSPDGTMNADKISVDGVYNTQLSFTSNTTYSLSIFIKKDTATSFGIGYVDTSGPFTGGSIFYNFATEVISVNQSPNSSVSGTAENYGNGWIRLIMKFTTNASSSYNYIETAFIGGSGWMYGAQLEAGSYATSYIPTTSASVTRNADVISKTGISSLIGQTEGTLFLDFYYDGSNNNHMIIRDPSYSTYIYFNSQSANQLWGQIQNANIQFSMSATAGRYKMALAYKSGSSALYVNGTQIGTSATTFSVVGTMSELDYTLSTPNNKINASALWKTRLTNTQLAQLTTI